MIILFTIINLVLVVLAIISLPWTLIGIPLGIYFLIKKDKNTKKVIICFLGPAILILAFILFPIVNIISTQLGGNIFQSGYGGIKPISSPVDIQISK
ncbi:hypothetical protein BH10PAT1_BH10PAT1_4550 [soil metagenome]